jgi:hypothetical protein
VAQCVVPHQQHQLSEIFRRYIVHTTSTVNREYFFNQHDDALLDLRQVAVTQASIRCGRGGDRAVSGEEVAGSEGAPKQSEYSGQQSRWGGEEYAILRPMAGLFPMDDFLLRWTGSLAATVLTSFSSNIQIILIIIVPVVATFVTIFFVSSPHAITSSNGLSFFN